MKKKHLLYFVFTFILAIVFVPKITYAEGAGFNHSTAADKTPVKDTSCPECSWYWKKVSGYRIGLYEYDGNGNPIKRGNSLELINKVNNTVINGYATNGYTRFDYEYGGKTVNFNNINGLNAKTITTYNKGSVLNIEFNVPVWGPGFIKNLVEYIGSDSNSIKDTMKLMFGYDNFDISKTAKYYISVEPTIQFYSRRGDFYIYGTGYEFVNVLGDLNNSKYTFTQQQLNDIGVTKSPLNFSESQGISLIALVYKALYVKKDSAEIINTTTKSYDQYNFVNHQANNGGLIVAGNNPPNKVYNVNHSNKNYPYGITVLWLKDIVDTPLTCKAHCEGYAGDALNNCANNFCNGDSNCKSECLEKVEDSPGCEYEYHNTCGKIGGNSLTSTDNICNADGSSNDKTLSSKICYDDASKSYTTESVIINKTDSNVTMTTASTPASIAYYKVECNENLKLLNMIKPTIVHVSNGLNAKLYGGYTMDYSKECQIYYKTSADGWTTEYDDSKIKEDLSYYEIARDKTNSLINSASGEEKTRLQGIMSKIDNIINELEAIKSSAEETLAGAKDKDQNNSQSLINEFKFVESNKTATSTTTHTVKLEPVYCIANPGSSVTKNYCDLETKKEFSVDITNNNVTCLDLSGNPITATLNSNNTSSSYREIVHYSLPSSYTGIDEQGASIVCHTDGCANSLKSAFEIKNAWVFNKLDDSVSLEAYNNIIGENNISLSIEGMGSCGQFKYGITCDYDFESSSICTKDCINAYTDPSSEMTEDEYNECFKKYCSCDSYCGSNVACRMKYCPQECEGCEDIKTTENSCDADSCLDDCNKTYSDPKKRLECRHGCCRSSCNGEVGCIYNCCVSECNSKREKGYITEEEEKLCLTMCSCENGSCPDDDTPEEGKGIDYIYRTINLNRPFPNGDNGSRTPGANWFGKVEYINQTDQMYTKHYDSTDGMTEEYEYRFYLTNDKIKEIKANQELNLSYTEFKESEDARNIYEDRTSTKADHLKANVYCSYIIHDYFKEIGIQATSNSTSVSNQTIVGSGCYTE